MPKSSSRIEVRHEPRSWLSRGYGIAPQLVMIDRRLSIGAKALFCYISSIAGSAPNPEFGAPASWPSRERICADLGIGKDTFTKYLRELRDAGYIRVEQKRAEGEKFSNNVYVICEIIDSPPPLPPDEPCPKKPDTDEPYPKKPDTEKPDTTNNRSLTSNIEQTKTRQDKTSPSRRVLRQFELFMGRNPSPTERRTLARLEAEFGTDWVETAFTEYWVQKDKRPITSPLAYIEGVLRNWRIEGMRLTDVLEHLRNMRDQERTNN